MLFGKRTHKSIEKGKKEYLDIISKKVFLEKQAIRTHHQSNSRIMV